MLKIVEAIALPWNSVTLTTISPVVEAQKMVFVGKNFVQAETS